jgi:hypothetical protein
MTLAGKSHTPDAGLLSSGPFGTDLLRERSAVLPRCGDHFSDSFLIRGEGSDIPQDETSF